MLQSFHVKRVQVERLLSNRCIIIILYCFYEHLVYHITGTFESFDIEILRCERCLIS